jgi:Fe-S-cluster containining protein|tara:strand:+ start:7311 stop:8057 length:747 start_codon:yes stop_codon:yes gene_type:complete
MNLKKKLGNVLKHLHNLYSKLPATEGCMEYINKPKEEGGCGCHCCHFISPQLLKIEFLNTWRHTVTGWTLEQIADLVEAAMNDYLDDKTSKGCVFLDRETSMCRQHDTRPLSCRSYGITPKEEFNSRYIRLKILYQDDITAVIKPQCNLVHTKDGRKVTVENTNSWWRELQALEAKIGIDRKDMTDEPGGTYRNYPEHILMHLLTTDNIQRLQQLRVYGNKLEKHAAKNEFMKYVRQNISKVQTHGKV